MLRSLTNHVDDLCVLPKASEALPFDFYVLLDRMSHRMNYSRTNLKMKTLSLFLSFSFQPRNRAWVLVLQPQRISKTPDGWSCLILNAVWSALLGIWQHCLKNHFVFGVHFLGIYVSAHLNCHHVDVRALAPFHYLIAIQT